LVKRRWYFPHLFGNTAYIHHWPTIHTTFSDNPIFFSFLSSAEPGYPTKGISKRGRRENWIRKKSTLMNPGGYPKFIVSYVDARLFPIMRGHAPLPAKVNDTRNLVISENYVFALLN
jgi:hypothetical protein